MRCSALLLAAVACAPEPVELAPPREREALTDPAAWTLVDAADDPFPDRPEGVTCGSGAWSVEVDGTSSALEIDTTFCDYVVLRQPSLAEVLPGDLVRARITHDALTAEAPAEAHLAVVVGDVTVLDATVPIPDEAGEDLAEVVVDEGCPEGATIWLHLHNHGDNSWALRTLDAGPPETP
ncbi:MAG: hypothetical protein H6738_24365 [Alphaproteobacteria bacterium]|nr:hypothetical protein [Alphaproteobacteria bacterium]